MKKILAIVIISGMLTAFRIHTAPTVLVENVKELSGYKLRNKNFNFNDFNLWIITNELSFNNEFIAESDEVTRPRFSEQWVVAAKVETHNYSYRVLFKKLILKDSILNIYFTVKKEGAALGGDGPVAISAFPKDKAIKKVNFYHNNVLVRSVPVVAVY